MDDAVELGAVRQRRSERLLVAEIDLFEREGIAVCARKAFEPRLLQRRIVIIVEIVDADDLSPRASSARAVDEPMNPAAPVMRTVMRPLNRSDPDYTTAI